MKPGSMVAQGQLLGRIQSIDYQTQVDQAASHLAEMELALAREKHKQTVALRVPDLERLTPLARHEPQVKAAEANRKAAESALAQALQKLLDTKIKAPFPAIVLKQTVTPEKWVQPGETLFTIADSRFIDVRVELSSDLWERLGDIAPGMNAKVINEKGKEWNAEIRYLSPTRDDKTRQRSLVLQVQEPYQGSQPLLPDQQIKVSFVGKQYSNLVSVPTSSLTEDSLIWTVDAQDHLQPEPVITLLNAGNETALVQFIEQSDVSRRIVRFPMGSMMQGQKVMPKLETQDKDAGL